MAIETFAPLFPRGEHPFSLGRHLLHDADSKAYDARRVASLRRPRSVVHESAVPPWDQGNIGQCTAEAALGLLMTEPFHRSGWNLTGTGDQSDTLAFYREETLLDDTHIPGHYEPNDTGSTGLWSMKVLQRRGLATSYHHIFSWPVLQSVLSDHPVSMGIAWFGSMFYPDRHGVVSFQSDIDEPIGGHQICVVGQDLKQEELIFRNSWGVDWGKDGYGRLTFADAKTLLFDYHGDVTYPILVGEV